VRRLVFAVAALVVADRFEPALLRSLEEARYEDPAKDFRFGNSDLFGLGPLVAYLREHPHGRQRRVLSWELDRLWVLSDRPTFQPVSAARHVREIFNARINKSSIARSGHEGGHRCVDHLRAAEDRHPASTR
jgi:hypothetical protein